MVPRQNHRLQAPDSGDEEEKEELFRRQQQLLLTHQAEVQYETLLSDIDPDKPLTEFVELGQIRPVPSDDNVDRPFEPGNKVDAFHLDAWWPRVVIKREEDEYTVAFMYPPDLLVVRRSELRSHWDLADGVWVRAKKEMMMGSNFSPGTAVEMNPNEERLFYAWFPAIYLGQLGIESFLLQYKKSNNSDVKIVVRGHQIQSQPPNSTERDFILLDKVDAFHDMGWWVGDITKVLKGNKYAVTLSCTKQEMEFNLLELRTHMDWNDGGWATMRHGRWITEVRVRCIFFLLFYKGKGDGHYLFLMGKMVIMFETFCFLEMRSLRCNFIQKDLMMSM
ncbi:DUF724 domain-containing protein 3-like isoform X1 [Malus domestica]|uniref:DUF724 domain-containing protein 3-like isoform X1 n=1 Tax=Malus domestica TaxID=3750 RepID=UPI0014610114